MYRYDEFDHALVRERVAEFSDQVARRASGALTEDEFKPLRLMNGVYLQLHAYMLRVAIPYGTFNSRQMRRLAHIARTYDKGYGHFTTRTNIQYNWPALTDLPAILSDLADVEMHAIQTSGNCIRNVTTDVFAGCADDEIEDPRPWCEILRQWSTIHPEFSFLPRKFKIAVTGAEKDRAAIRTHDVGLQIVRGEDGGTAFRVFVGGAGEDVGRGVAGAVARGLDGVHFDVGQIAQDRRQVGQGRPVVLDVRPRGEMAVALVIGAGDVRQPPHLPAVERPIGNGDPQHIGVQLQIDAVHQPQRLELVLGQGAGRASRHLVGELRHPLAHQRMVELVIAIHQPTPPDTLWPTVGPAERMRSFSRSRPEGVWSCTSTA